MVLPWRTSCVSENNAANHFLKGGAVQIIFLLTLVGTTLLWQTFRFIFESISDGSVNLVHLLRPLQSSQLDSASEGSHSPTLYMWVKLTTLGRKISSKLFFGMPSKSTLWKIPKTPWNGAPIYTLLSVYFEGLLRGGFVPQKDPSPPLPPEKPTN